MIADLLASVLPFGLGTVLLLIAVLEGRKVLAVGALAAHAIKFGMLYILLLTAATVTGVVEFSINPDAAVEILQAVFNAAMGVL